MGQTNMIASQKDGQDWWKIDPNALLQISLETGWRTGQGKDEEREKMRVRKGRAGTEQVCAVGVVQGYSCQLESSLSSQE